MKEFIREYETVNIEGKDYSLRELSLSEKIKLLGGVGSFIKDIAKNAFFRKNDNGSISFNFIDEVSLAELNIDKIILSSLEILPELLKLSIPDFNGRDNLPETETRNILIKAVELNDFKGFIANFFSLAASIIR